MGGAGRNVSSIEGIKDDGALVATGRGLAKNGAQKECLCHWAEATVQGAD